LRCLESRLLVASQLTPGFLTPPAPAATLSGAYLAGQGSFLSLPQQYHLSGYYWLSLTTILSWDELDYIPVSILIHNTPQKHEILRVLSYAVEPVRTAQRNLKLLFLRLGEQRTDWSESSARLRVPCVCGRFGKRVFSPLRAGLDLQIGPILQSNFDIQSRW
jgi:hypothetical protein